MISNQVLTKGNRGILLLALFFGLVSAILIYVYLSSTSEDSGGQISGPTQPVVVAAQNIPAGTSITAEMVEVKLIPEGLVPTSVFNDIESAVGQVSAVSLIAGEQIISGRVSASGIDLTQFGDDPPLSVVIPEGMRGFSVQVSEVTASGGLIRPGDYVDVIMSGEISSSEASASISTSVACYVLQDIQVLAISQNVAKPVTGAEAESGVVSSPIGDPNPESASATLAVTPVLAWRLAAAQNSVDRLGLALRPFGERGSVTGLPECALSPGS